METEEKRVDVVIMGAGFAGSLMAMIATRLGKSVLLLEKGQHPRFAIGESTTPLTNLLLEEIAKIYDLEFLTDLATWGRWQRSFPQLAVGLKRGFSFFHHQEGMPFQRSADRRNELLVAANPCDELADTHWFRADFDQFLVDQAVGLGVNYYERATVVALNELEDEITVKVQRDGQLQPIRATLLIDATGPRGALSKLLDLGEQSLPGMPTTRSLFGHFEGVRWCGELDEFVLRDPAPYPIDDAAVHHVFSAGWLWELHFNQGVTSAGIVAREDWEGWTSGGEDADWESCLRHLPTLKHQFAGSTLLGPMRSIARLPYFVDRIASRRWVQLPSAVASIDPLFSTGFPLSLLGVLRLGCVLRDAGLNGDFRPGLTAYTQTTVTEVERVGRLIGLAYRFMNRPRVFNLVTYLYFAVVSFEEVSRRLGRGCVDQSFLSGGEPWVLSGLEQAMSSLEEFDRETTRGAEAIDRLETNICSLLEPFNVIGIGRRDRGNWYPVDIGDLFDNRAKLGASVAEIRAMLEASGIPVSRLSAWN